MTITAYVLEISKICNEHCPFCYSTSSYKHKSSDEHCKLGQLTGEEWKRALKNIQENGAEAVDLSGGESTLHPAFTEIIEYAKKLGLQVIVSTNGCTIGIDKIRKSIEKNADFVSISVQGSTAKVHDAVKQHKGAFEYSLKSVNSYYRTYKKTGHPKLKVNTVVCKINLKDAVNVGKLIKVDNRDLIWKVVQVIPREAGQFNKEKVVITDQQFLNLQRKIIKMYPKAYAKGRIIFREDDTTKDIHSSAYLIARSDGELLYPKGEEHHFHEINILEKGLLQKIKKAHLKQNYDYEAFSHKLKSNHYKNYKSLALLF